MQPVSNITLTALLLITLTLQACGPAGQHSADPPSNPDPGSNIQPHPANPSPHAWKEQESEKRARNWLAEAARGNVEIEQTNGTMGFDRVDSMNVRMLNSILTENNGAKVLSNTDWYKDGHKETRIYQQDMKRLHEGWEVADLRLLASDSLPRSPEFRIARASLPIKEGHRMTDWKARMKKLSARYLEAEWTGQGYRFCEGKMPARLRLVAELPYHLDNQNRILSLMGFAYTDTNCTGLEEPLGHPVAGHVDAALWQKTGTETWELLDHGKELGGGGGWGMWGMLEGIAHTGRTRPAFVVKPGYTATGPHT